LRVSGKLPSKGDPAASYTLREQHELLIFTIRTTYTTYIHPNIFRVIKSRKIRWVGHVARLGEGRGVYRVLVGKPEGKRPLGRQSHRWEDNIKMDLQEVGCGGMD